MNRRFPLLDTYRKILQWLSGLIVVVGFFGAIALANETQPITGESEFRLSVFLTIFIPALTFAIGTLVTTEFIKLSLFVENHLYEIARLTMRNEKE